ncbi:MBL fold metallo-hydrolase [Fredinandcohnia humi]
MRILKTFTSKHFKIKKISNGIYAAIDQLGGGSFSNSGIIDLGDQTIIFDTFNTPQAAKDLRDAAEVLIGKQITYVINSHWHGDHIRGNQIFEDCHILATQKTKELMDAIHPERIQQQQNTIEQLTSYILTLEGECEKEDNEEKKQLLIQKISQLKEIEHTLPSLRLVTPSVTFTENYTLKGTRREIQVVSFGGGHTSSDLFLYLPQDNLIFAGDLLTVQNHPFLRDGNPEEWVSIIDKMVTLSFDKIVPGHGVIGSKTDLIILKEYILKLIEFGRNKDEALKEEIQQFYHDWNAGEILQMNFEYMLSRS